MKNITITAVAILAITTVSGAQAAPRMASPAQLGLAPHVEAPMRAGTLSCENHAEHATCVFEHSAGVDSFTETYDTTLTRRLMDKAMSSGHAMRWAVFTPGGKADPGMLLGARPNNSVASSDGSTGVKVSFRNGDQPITFQQIGNGSAATNDITNSTLELMPSSKPIDVPSKKSLELTSIQ